MSMESWLERQAREDELNLRMRSMAVSVNPVLKDTQTQTPKEDANKVYEEVNHPSHYQSGGMECIDAIRAALGPEGFLAYCRGNAIKYSWRAGKKGPNSGADMGKAAVYAKWAAEVEL